MPNEEEVASICELLGLTSNHERITKLSDLQLEYISSPIDTNVFLRACPGSGKTEVVGIKAACEIKRWGKRRGGITILTFTNNAASEIKDRVIDLLGDNLPGYPHFIGTLDSWLLGYIVNPFSSKITGYSGLNDDHSIKLVDNSFSGRFLHAYKTKYQYAKRGEVFSNQFYFEMREDTSHWIFNSGNRTMDTIRNNINIVVWQENDLLEAKMKFWNDGFCTYQDIEFLGYLLLTERSQYACQLSRRFPYIIIDECQDLSWIQLQYLQILKNKGSILHFVGDINQAIYEFKKVNPDDVVTFCEANQFYQYSLSRNYRSTQKIVDICDRLVAQTRTMGNPSEEISPACLLLPYKVDEMTSLSTSFEQLLNNQKIDLQKAAILSRSWSNVAKLRPCSHSKIKTKQLKLATSFYLWRNKSNDKSIYREAIELAGSCIGEIYFAEFNQIKKNFYCPEIITIPFKWRLFVARVLDSIMNSHLECFDLKMTWQEWCQLIRDILPKALQDHINIIHADLLEDFNFRSLGGNDFRIPNNEGGNSVLSSLSLATPNHSNVLITTIHAVKGQTFDAMMLVSSKNRVGTEDGHWTQWLENPRGEAARLAYVASSRPKHLLVWAIPNPLESEINQLSQLGFELLTNALTPTNIFGI